jgi:hypothetical protein
VAWCMPKSLQIVLDIVSACLSFERTHHWCYGFSGSVHQHCMVKLQSWRLSVILMNGWLMLRITSGSYGSYIMK